MKYNRDLVSRKITNIRDSHMADLYERWHTQSHPVVSWQDFIPQANEWFLGSNMNTLHGVEHFPHIDVTQGNTHYIESFCLKYGWDGFQILNNEYAYYTMMGKYGVDLDQLQPNVPMMVTIPDFFSGGIRSEWEQLLQIAEQRNIDLHLDLAWIMMARGIEIDMSHPCIKSFGISMSKLNLNWNRAGLRWSRQRTMDSITILNHYYKVDINTNLYSCASFHMNNMHRDHAWLTHGEKNQDICNELGLEQTVFVHCVQNGFDNVSGLSCITDLLIDVQ